MRERSKFQQKLIRNYYENRDNILMQSLGEIVSELYLAPNDRRRVQLWKRATVALERIGVEQKEIERLNATRDLAALARIVSREF